MSEPLRTPLSNRRMAELARLAEDYSLVADQITPLSRRTGILVTAETLQAIQVQAIEREEDDQISPEDWIATVSLTGTERISDPDDPNYEWSRDEVAEVVRDQLFEAIASTN